MPKLLLFLVKQFKCPFIKCEAKSRRFCPLYKEFEQFPIITSQQDIIGLSVQRKLVNEHDTVSCEREQSARNTGEPDVQPSFESKMEKPQSVQNDVSASLCKDVLHCRREDNVSCRKFQHRTSNGSAAPIRYRLAFDLCIIYY